MKKTVYTTILLAALVAHGCSDDPIDRRLSPSDFFVTFETNNGANKSASAVEGDTVTLTVTMAATMGSPVTVDFDVTPPTAASATSASYTLLAMDNAPLAAKSLVFPQGTGAQSFKFVAFDNEDTDGHRTFTFTLTGVSAGYRLGVNATGEGASFPVNVIDDETTITMEELLGEWEVHEDLYSMNHIPNDGWRNGITYSIIVEKVDDTTIKMKGLCYDALMLFGANIAVTATVSLNTKIKSITIPFQLVASGETNYYFSRYLAFGTGFDDYAISKDSDNTLTIELGEKGTYEVAPATPDDPPTRLGDFCIARGTVFVKHP
jgi:hypothetical protein